MAPYFTNDAIVFGLLIVLLAFVFKTSASKNQGWQKFYRYIPPLLLCYFLPALFNWPLGLIAPHWYANGLLDVLISQGITLPADIGDMNFDTVQTFLRDSGLNPADFEQYERHSQLYFMASRYMLPASLILLCLSIDLKGIMRLGPKALIMFFAATIGIVIGGPIALWLGLKLFPEFIGIDPQDVWRGLSTVAGSWIGGGANQTAMKEIFDVGDSLFAAMIVVDVVVANIWMGFLLYGAGITKKLDRILQSDTSALEDLKERVQNYRKGIERIPTTTDIFVLMAIGFGGVALAHWGTANIAPWMEGFRETLEANNLNSLMSKFFWLIVLATTMGVAFSFTPLRKLEGVGASRWGSVFIYVLVATIGMKMNLGEISKIWGLFVIGLIWMSIHVVVLLTVAKIIKAPFFFVAVGSQANVGGAASAPIVASAFSPALAPVGVLMAVLGYALGTYGAIICALLMQAISG
jgi:uncharacterized membrane protein